MIQTQLEILNKICNLLINASAPKKVDKLLFYYRFNRKENWSGAALRTIIDGKKESPSHTDNWMNEVVQLCEQLHDVMQKHTGGDWQKFTLTIDEEGEAHTEFSYEPQSCLDGFEFEFAKDFK